MANGGRAERWIKAGTGFRLLAHRLMLGRLKRRYRKPVPIPKVKTDAEKYRRTRLFQMTDGTPLQLRVTEVKRLDPEAGGHATYSITFEGENGPVAEPNDALVIRWKNTPERVNQAIELLGEDPDRLVRISTATTGLIPGRVITTPLRDALTEHIELQTASTALIKRHGFEQLLEHNKAERKRYIGFYQETAGEKAPGTEAFSENFKQLSWRSLVRRLKQQRGKPPAKELLAEQDRVSIRPYTMSGYERSSDGAFRASITVSMVEKQLESADGGEETVEGRATSFLQNLVPGDAVEGYVIADVHVFPQTLDRDVPLIIICTGAGIAGPMSLLRAGYSGGPLWLIYGVRNWKNHHLYGGELQKYVDDGVVTRLHVAESRPTENGTPKRYVQDVLKENGDEVVSWLKDGAHVYLGGRLSMGVAVNRTIRDLLIETGECPDEEAANQRLHEWHNGLRFQASVSRV